MRHYFCVSRGCGDWKRWRWEEFTVEEEGEMVDRDMREGGGSLRDMMGYVSERGVVSVQVE